MKTRASKRELLNKAIAVACSVVLTVGLMPAPAFAEAGAHSGLQDAAAQAGAQLQAATTDLDNLQAAGTSDELLAQDDGQPMRDDERFDSSHATALDEGEPSVQDDQLSVQAGDKLTNVHIVDTPNFQNNTLYVRDGAIATFNLQMTNTSGRTLDYAQIVEAETYIDEYGDENPYISHGMEAENATWSRDDIQVSNSEGWVRAGFTIAKGATATIPMTFDASHLDATTETGVTKTYTIKMGRRHTIWVPEVHENYTDWVLADPPEEIEDEFCTFSVDVCVYKTPSALTVGTGASNNLTPLPSSGIDFGTVTLGGANQTGSITFTAVNSTDTTSLADAHGNSTAVTLREGWDWESVNYAQMPFSFTGMLTTGSTNLRPVKATGSSLDVASATIGYDVSGFVAGTYTLDFVLSTVPHRVSVNGGETASSGEYHIPVTITIQGENQSFLPAATDLTATAGSGLVELEWMPAEESNQYTTYDVWRWKGHETATDGNDVNWSNYEKIGSVTKGETNGKLLFVDGGVQNDTEYSYTVITGNPGQGYAARPVCATPSATIESRIFAPDVACTSKEGSVGISWTLDSHYGGDQNDGAGMLDHFNIYRDGVLVDQVGRSAVYDNVQYAWHEEPPGSGTSVYGPVSHSYSWSVDEPVPECYTPYSWQVAAVSLNGLEGYWSQASSYEGTITYGYGMEPEVFRHEADYDPGNAEYGEPTCINAKVFARVGDYSPGFELRVWRADGTTAPAAPAPVGNPYLVTSDHTYGTYTVAPYVFKDTDVRGNWYYTYTVQMVTYEGEESPPYSFTVKTTAYASYESPSVTWSVVDGTTARLRFYNPDDYTALVYRDGRVIDTYTDSGWEYGDTEDNPGRDGTYVYRVDFVTNGLTIPGSEYTFVRNTAPVDDSALLKAPATPTLSGRVSGDSNVILSWAPGLGGGAAEGYHVYRKDAGNAVIGRHNLAKGSSAWADWGNGRYLTIQDAETFSFVDGRINGYEVNYKDDPTLGRLSGVSWGSDSVPHEYWITAYNHAGESAPSRIVTFSVDGSGNPYTEGAAVPDAPSKPSITKAWVDWEDESNMSGGFDTMIGGVLRTAWEDSVLGADVDKWTLEYANTNQQPSGGGNPTETLLAFQAANDSAAKLGTADVSPVLSISANTGTGGTLGRVVGVTVKAENAGGSATSDAVSVNVTSFPRFRTVAGSGEALLQWTDLFDGSNTPDTSVAVNSWEIWRKAEYGTWERVKTLDGASAYAGTETKSSRTTSFYEYTDTGLDNGWAYEYKVVAKCSDSVDRESAIKEVMPDRTLAIQPPGAPQNLRAEVVNGKVVLSWDPPASGGAVKYYRVKYESDNVYQEQKIWSDDVQVTGDSTSAVVSIAPDVADSPQRFFVYAYTYIDGEMAPAHTGGVTDGPDEYPSASNVVTVTRTQQDINAIGTAALGKLYVTATTPADGQVRLSWQACEGAMYYQVKRDDDAIPNATIATVNGQESYTFTDVDAEPGVRHRYTVTAYGGQYYSDASVYVMATGKTRDEMVAQRMIELIGQLRGPDEVDMTDAEQIEAVQEVWVSLTDKQRQIATQEDPAAVQKLADDIEAIRNLEVLARYAEAAQAVEAAIAALPDAANVKAADEDAINEARRQYNALGDGKRLVRNTQRLTDAEAAYAAGVQSASSVESQIGRLPQVSAVTQSNWIQYRDAIDAAWDAYQALNTFQAKVSDDAVSKVADLHASITAWAQQLIDDATAVDNQITALPDPANVQATTADENAITAARAAYTALGESGQYYVTKLERLEACEEALVAKQQEALEGAVGISGGATHIPVGGTTTVTATKDASDGLAWETSNSQVATVSDGVVTGLRPSETPIQVKATFTRTGYNNATLSTTKTTSLYVCSTELQNAGDVMYSRDRQFGVTSVPGNLTFTWASSNTAYATVDQTGKVHGVARTPQSTSVKITATCVQNADIVLEKDIEVTPIMLGSIGFTPTAFTYNGSSQLPSIVVYDVDGVSVDEANYDLTLPADATSVGQKTVTATGKNDYAGEVSNTYSIDGMPITSVQLSTYSFTYNGGQQRPGVTVRCGDDVLTEGVDYQVGWPRDTTNVGTKTVTVTGVGIYGSVLRANYTINARPVTYQTMHRLYNPNSGEHFYTASASERDMLRGVGWAYEGEGWKAPVAGANVYRLYNANAGDHHYTTSAAERDYLVGVGWSYEGVGWKSGGSKPLYRQYNPNAVAGAHNYTTSKSENDFLVGIGWRAEGIGWYGV